MMLRFAYRTYNPSMCGRYGLKSDKQKIADEFHAKKVSPKVVFAPNYNVAPSIHLPVVRLDEEGNRELTLMRWGLIPFFSKDGKAANRMTNARAETVATLPAYREAFRRRRCIVPADWFYEWQGLDPQRKKTQSWAIARKDRRLLGMAGLWESWNDPVTLQPLETYTILTTEPNEVMQPIHTRMPFILRPEEYQRWLEPFDPARPPTDLLRPSLVALEAWKVDPKVGNVRNTGPELCEPWADDLPTPSLFG
ncbi:SOS response-associated peptidase [Tunturiibacter psychrotolerans]|uniref:SOS response-associated peptidase n=1 Tax=Tunturiibacter psychrotolerans TaxID=3069686 RepID=UPI003D229D6D